MIWYRKLGFFSNPFSIKPGGMLSNVVAYDMPFIYEKIDNAETVFIEGEYGTGKTTILKNIVNRYKGRNKIIYYSFNTGTFNLEQLLDGANSFLRKLSGLKVRNIILLLDEVQSMTNKDAKNLLKHYTDGTVQSIIFVSHDYDKVKFPDEFTHLLNGNILRTIDLTDKEAIQLVKSRIGEIELFSDARLKEIYKLTKNPRRYLEYCEDVARYAVEIGDTEVTDFHIDEVLGEIKKASKKKVVVKTKVEQKPQEDKVPEPVETEPLTEQIEEASLVSEVVEEEPEELKVESDKKKFKVNKLITNSKTNPLGEVGENDEEDVPEYKVYFFED